MPIVTHVRSYFGTEPNKRIRHYEHSIQCRRHSLRRKVIQGKKLQVFV